MDTGIQNLPPLIRTESFVIAASFLQKIRAIMQVSLVTLVGLLIVHRDTAFAPSIASSFKSVALFSSEISNVRTVQKDALLGLLGRRPSQREGVLDSVLADPVTKEAIRINTMGAMFGDSHRGYVQFDIFSSTNKYEGSSDTYINLLEPKKKMPTLQQQSDSTEGFVTTALKRLTPLIPPPLRGALATAGADMGDFVPMRDLFTSPAVSFAYERGWRQGFAQAGFPGPDVEFSMAKEYFAPAVTRTSTVVDMSCATGMI